MNITKEQADRVTVLAVRIAVWLPGESETGRALKNDAAEIADIMRGLAEDAEPALLTKFNVTGAVPAVITPTVTFATTSPQAAQTALKSESSAQAAQAPARPPSEGKPIEALALTEAQEREAFEEFMLTKYPAHLCHWVGDQYSEMFTRLVFVGWKAGRAGSKP